MMLHHMGEHAAAEAIEAALLQTFHDGIKTGDLSGSATTAEFTDAIIARLPKTT